MGDYPILTGDVSRRLYGVKKLLRERAARCRAIAAAQEDPDGPHAASLRGKAKGMDEAIALIESIERGRRLPRKAKSHLSYRRMWRGGES